MLYIWWNKYWDDLDWFFLYYRYNKLSSGVFVIKIVLSDVGFRIVIVVKNVGLVIVKKLGEIRYYNYFNIFIFFIIFWNIM